MNGVDQIEEFTVTEMLYEWCLTKYKSLLLQKGSMNGVDQIQEFTVTEMLYEWC